MTSGNQYLGSGCSTGGTGPGDDVPAHSLCDMANVTQHDLGRKMVKRKCLKEGALSPCKTTPEGTWGTCAVSSDVC